MLRLHLRSTIKHVDDAEQEAFCLTPDGWAGVGWGCWAGVGWGCWAGVGWGCWADARAALTWDEYQQVKGDKGEPLNPSAAACTMHRWGPWYGRVGGTDRTGSES